MTLTFKQYLSETEAPVDNEERYALLKKKLLAGETPTVAHAGYSRGSFSLGDLRNLGYMRKEQVRRGRYYEEWDELTDKGKKDKIKFKMGGKLYGVGGLDKTEPMEVDYD